MVNRPFWLDRIAAAWARRPVVWLRGVRRSGKTVLGRSIPGAEYLDCELPRERQRLEDPEGFFSGLGARRLVLDEIHRLPDPAAVLKIAADHFPDLRVLATGSSSLEASARFKDKLTGRKSDIWLTPMNEADRAAFGCVALKTRLERGGLPPFFTDAQAPAQDYQEWVDSFWARDIQELFRLERRASFGRFLELLFASSGGVFEATRFAGPCEVSRQTIVNYLAVLEATMAAHVVRPFSARMPTEIVHAPKVYGFDTGFVRHFKGIGELRDQELGHLWEHYCLNEVQSLTQNQPRYWRDKQGHEVDFVLAEPGKAPLAVECKWRGSGFDPTGLAAFRRLHPGGENLVVCSDAPKPYDRTVGGLRIRFCGLESLRL